MAMSNAERQKRWLEKNRALHNFRRRKKTAVPVLAEPLDPKLEPVMSETGESGEARVGAPEKTTGLSTETTCGGSLPFETKKVGQFKMIVLNESKPVEETPVKPLIYRDDYGRVITEGQWNKLQELKRRAKEGGYERDEYSQ